MYARTASWESLVLVVEIISVHLAEPGPIRHRREVPAAARVLVEDTQLQNNLTRIAKTALRASIAQGAPNASLAPVVNTHPRQVSHAPIARLAHFPALNLRHALTARLANTSKLGALRAPAAQKASLAPLLHRVPIRAQHARQGQLPLLQLVRASHARKVCSS